MTRVIEALRYMVNKERVSVMSVSVALRCTEQQARDAIQASLKVKNIDLVEWAGMGRAAFYRITAAGVERSKFQPVPHAELQRRARARRAQNAHVGKRQDEGKERRKARAAETLAEESRQRAVLAAIEREEERARIAGLAEFTVQGAKAKRHALDLAWRAMA